MQEKQVAILIDGDKISPKYAECIKQEAVRLGRIKVLDLLYQMEEGTVVPETNEEDAEEQQDVIEDADAEETISVPKEEEIINCILNMLEEDWENLASVGI